MRNFEVPVDKQISSDATIEAVLTSVEFHNAQNNRLVDHKVSTWIQRISETGPASSCAIPMVVASGHRHRRPPMNRWTRIECALPMMTC